MELACGTGILTGMIAQKFPHSTIIGIDITENYLEMAKRKLGSYQNVSFVCQDAEELELEEKFDCIVSSYIPKYCDPKILVPKCIRHLKPGGKIILHDFTFPKNKSVRFFWRLHFVILRIVGGFIPEWSEAFAKLPKLIQASTWTNGYKAELQKNGFDVTISHYTWNCSAMLVATHR